MSDTIEIIISSPDGGMRWDAWLGEVQLVNAGDEPLFEACRVLLKRGVPPGTRIASRHAGSKHRSLTTTVGYGAAHTVVERNRSGLSIEPYKQNPFASRIEPRTITDPDQAPGQQPLP